LCEFIGQNRSKINRDNNIKDAKIGGQDGVNADIQGFKAEYAFCKHFNLFPDFNVTPRNGSADGVTKKGTRYDIKSTDRKNGNLLSTLKVNNDIDVYILAYIDNDTVEFIGWAKKTDLIREENIKNLEYGNVYFLDRSKLIPF
jgi:hypothetical protein